MRVAALDTDVVDYDEPPNELASIADGDLPTIWAALTARLLAIPEYEDLFQAAYPEMAAEDLGFEFAANAIAAYEIEAFSFDDSPWDRYLAGEPDALSEEAKAGALLFYGDAGCGECHSGVLLTDQEYHNIGAPQLGPGKDESGLDYGRYLETEDLADKFAFRTPPLRNVALTGPYLHNGAYGSLEDVVRHHLNASESLENYDSDQLPPLFRRALHDEPEVIHMVLSTLDPLMEKRRELTAKEFEQLMAFFHSLTSPSAVDLSGLVPDSVPSGLPVMD
jgi:cytochrome c peroxidase